MTNIKIYGNDDKLVIEINKKGLKNSISEMDILKCILGQIQDNITEIPDLESEAKDEPKVEEALKESLKDCEPIMNEPIEEPEPVIETETSNKNNNNNSETVENRNFFDIWKDIKAENEISNNDKAVASEYVANNVTTINTSNIVEVKEFLLNCGISAAKNANSLIVKSLFEKERKAILERFL